jgi:hypothetical protein
MDLKLPALTFLVLSTARPAAAFKNAAALPGSRRCSFARGRELAARFTLEPDGLRLEVEEQSARYPITIDPIAQQAYLKSAAVGTTQAGIMCRRFHERG